MSRGEQLRRFRGDAVAGRTLIGPATGSISSEKNGNIRAHCHFLFPTTNYLCDAHGGAENDANAFALRWWDA
jgi:hypothetical protein